MYVCMYDTLPYIFIWTYNDINILMALNSLSINEHDMLRCFAVDNAGMTISKFKEKKQNVCWLNMQLFQAGKTKF